MMKQFKLSIKTDDVKAKFTSDATTFYERAVEEEEEKMWIKRHLRCKDRIVKNIKLHQYPILPYANCHGVFLSNMQIQEHRKLH